MKWLTYIVFFTTFQLCAQSVIKPFLKLAFYQSYLEIPRVSELELGVGVQFGDYVSTQINIRGSQQGKYQNSSGSFRFATLFLPYFE